MRLLVIEDEADLAEPLVRGLRREGYAVDLAFDGTDGLQLLEETDYDLLILDLSLPGMDGLSLLQHVRPGQPELLVLILTARSARSDLVCGLDRGADDYLVKPFYFDELLARVRALLRRDLRAREPVLHHRTLRLDTARHKAWDGNRELVLTRKEFAILEHLMRHAGEVVSQEELLDHVWDAQVNPVTNVLPVHINALRRALRDTARDPRYIRTVIGKGYQLL